MDMAGYNYLLFFAKKKPNKIQQLNFLRLKIYFLEFSCFKKKLDFYEHNVM